ncbi:pyridoxal phosphate-dependent decarboxylase family protein [Actinoplanes sp. NPDC051513]|uniref:pyridoxal phosphate-dependent decarboxylase family protein n=1 Tax=Actinoplanes sp. NPDC051513 TaxID=3363908 RepID=UPI00378C9785
MSQWKEVLEEAAQYAVGYLDGLPDRRVGSSATLDELRETLGGELPERGESPRDVIASLARHADPGVVASSSGRFFGFVIGGATPAALAADWLTSVWDQNAGLYVIGPAASVVEETAGRWLAGLLGLPDGVSAGFVTGAQMANFTGLAVALHEVLGKAGWDVAESGLRGAPPVRVLAGRGRHGTIDRALRFLGVGTGAIVEVEMDDQGRMLPSALGDALKLSAGPAIVCAQLGNVNSGALDPVGQICDLAHAHGAWVHVDGAFGLWAAASPRLRGLVDGVGKADSWATDAHKWLNVPYDSGLVFCAHPDAHRATMGARAGYLVHATEGERDALDYGPEHSRRARGFAVYATLRALGRDGVAELVDRCCALAARFAERLAASGRVEILGDVVLNQVLVRVPGADADARTRELIDRVQRDGTCWMSGTTWQGKAAMRISVSNWSTSEADVDRSVTAILSLI